eukprot:CAMPEP_0185316846 /NCGR_PEP_ID=MMETSP1363-20130426/45263_1 /TAXON_ID=38817 /ORGANISM="Gephyrocapsa oceanica, Strain RCC1303" /LENGTH=35 /DNA_ID= /DNA_START= /DNA_END= /DNA_ORIENTATION=
MSCSCAYPLLSARVIFGGSAPPPPEGVVTVAVTVA